MHFDASFFVALAFVLLIAGFIKLKLPARVIEALDERATAIKAELDEARNLRQEAMAVLADYKKRVQEAEKEAAVLIEQAQEDAKRIAEESTQALQERLERKTKQAEEKITRAEAQLIQEVRCASGYLAVDAAAVLIAQNMTATQSNKLVKDTVARLAKNFH